MSIFTTNQARQLYVVNAFQSQDSTLSNVGDIKVVKQGDCIFFEHLGAAGVTRSDLIPIDSITYAKATKASAMAPKRKTMEVTLNSDVNDGDPVATEHYILKVNYRQFVGMSDEDSYTEIAEAIGGSSASALYRDLALSLAKNDSKQGLIEVKLGTSGADVVVVPELTKADLTGTYTKIKITAAEPEWVLGKKAYAPAKFELSASPIISGTLEVAPFTFATGTAEVDGNGKVIADLEWFCMGERADIYRGAGWPNNIDTKYLVDPTHQYGVIDIHFAYQGTCEDIQKSEKDIELVVDCGTAGTTYTEINKVIAAINTATGVAVSVSGVTEGDDTATGTAGSALLTALS